MSRPCPYEHDASVISQIGSEQCLLRIIHRAISIQMTSIQMIRDKGVDAFDT